MVLAFLKDYEQIAQTFKQNPKEVVDTMTKFLGVDEAAVMPLAQLLRREGLVPGAHLVPYLNRLADLVWVFARAAERAESRAATPARQPRGATRRETNT